MHYKKNEFAFEIIIISIFENVNFSLFGTFQLQIQNKQFQIRNKQLQIQNKQLQIQN